MLGTITVRIYADNFFAQPNTTRYGTEYVRPENGMYHVNTHMHMVYNCWWDCGAIPIHCHVLHHQPVLAVAAIALH